MADCRRSNSLEESSTSSLLIMACLIISDNEFYQGGIGDAVLDAVASYRNMIVRKLAVNAVPRSGPPAELLEMFGISADNIVRAVNDVVKL